MPYARELDELIRDLQAAITAATGRLGAVGLRVDEVEVDVKTALTRRAGGELDLKVVKLGGGLGSERAVTVSVAFKPSPVTTAAGVEGEVIDALEVIEGAVAAIGDRFALSTAVVELDFATTTDGKLAVVVAGEASRTETHTARLKLAAD